MAHCLLGGSEQSYSLTRRTPTGGQSTLNVCQEPYFVFGSTHISAAWGAASLGSIDVALWAIAFSPSNLSPDAG